MSRFTRLIQLLGLTILVLLIFSCSSNDINKQSVPQEITVVLALQKDVPIYNEFVGQAYGSSDIPIRARVSGFLEGIHFTEGSMVTKNQLLYTIDPQPYKAKVAVQQSQLAEAKTAMIKAKSDLDRIEPLAEINAVSKSDLDAAVAQYNAAKASVDAARSSLELAKIDLSYCRVLSPIDGLIGKTKAKVGEFVGQNPNPVILNTVSITDSIVVEFFLTETDYIELAKRAISMEKENNSERERVNTDIKLLLADGSEFPENGRINFVDRGVDPKTGTILVQAEFANPDGLLRPGLFAKLRIRVEIVEDAIVVPQRCVMELQGINSVYVVNDSNKVVSQRVKVGTKINDYWLIKEGLKANDKVVIDALQKVRDGSVIEPKVIEFKSKFNN
ncbi:MAG: efflux RND transporter periplasmic adaptor subunit [Marinilabiliales bacterium]|nr:MAG: efflux RND transporter periplasmic adaptor subunit [Marinilabiliales bacterium]